MTMVNEMVQQRDEAARELPPLPTWESTPEDLKAATRAIKSALRRRIEASGRTVEQVFAVMEERVTQRVEEIEAALRNGENAWPVVEYADIESGRVTAADLALLQRRGCLVVRGHFPREQALGWDRDIVDYVDRNRFFETLPGAGRRLLRQRRLETGDLPDLLVARPDGGPTARPDGSRPVLPQRPVEEQLGRRPVVRPRPRLALPRPHPPPAPGRRLRRPGHPPGPGHPRPLDDAGLPEGVPAPLRRQRGAVRPVGRGVPDRGAAVPRHRRCARPSVPSRAGPPCRTWTTTRASCTPCRSPRPWAT